jgi:hypothetical protein
VATWDKRASLQIEKKKNAGDMRGQAAHHDDEEIVIVVEEEGGRTRVMASPSVSRVSQAGEQKKKSFVSELLLVIGGWGIVFVCFLFVLVCLLGS